MPLHFNDLGIWKELPATGLNVKVGGSWIRVKVGWVKVAGVWKVFHQTSDPIVHTAYANTWSTVYRGTSGVISNRGNGDKLAYWGNSWNGEIERTMLGLNDAAALQQALVNRPVILSGVARGWVGHVYSGTRRSYIGFHGSVGEPSLFERLHSEQDSAWSIPIDEAKPGGAGAAVSAALPASVLTNLSAQIIAGNIRGLTQTDEGSTGAPRWGWNSGAWYSTSNSGGSAGGLIDIRNTTDSHSLRLDLTIDY